MPLPAPIPGDPPPQRQLTVSAHAAILDDGTIERQIRVAVLHELERAANPRSVFTSICDGESFGGPFVSDYGTLRTGRAMTLAAFERGLVNGWFGVASMLAPVARDIVDGVKSAFRDHGAGKVSLAKLQAMLDPGSRPTPLTLRVTWYFYDEADRARPMRHVAPNLALRLALPSAAGSLTAKAEASEYIVFEIAAVSLDDPRKARFTDCGDLTYLKVWRPGGRTAPLVSGLAGLDELVDRPVLLGRAAEAFHIVRCDEL